MKIIANQTEYDVPVDHWQFDHKARARWHTIRMIIFGLITLLFAGSMYLVWIIARPSIKNIKFYEWGLDCQHQIIEPCQAGANAGGVLLCVFGLLFMGLILAVGMFPHFGGDSSPDELI